MERDGDAADRRHRPLQRRLDRRRHAHGAVRAERHRNGRGQRHAAWSRRCDLTGDVAVMARYQGQVGVFRASDAAGRDGRQPAAGEELRRRAGLREAQGAGRAAVGGVRRRDVPAPRRRSTSPAGCRRPKRREQFLADSDPDKRDKLVDTLLDSTDYADYFANKWSADPAQQAAAGHRQARGTFALPRLDSRQPAREQAVRPVRPRDPDGDRRDRRRTRRSPGIAK